MRTSCRAFALVLFLSLGFPAAAAGPVTIGDSKRLHSAVLDEDRDYDVSLPASYQWAENRRYPVLYVLDGKSHFAHTTGSVNYLSAQGVVPEMIVVAVASTVRVRDFTQTDWPKAWIGGGGAANFKRFLSSELIPGIERTYRTNGFRILSGHSAGGQFALYGLSSSPALFQAYFALSPSLDWDDRLPVRSLETFFGATRDLAAFLYVGQEEASGGALADYDRLHAVLKMKSPKRFRWTYEAFPDENHTSLPLVGQIRALRALYSGYRLPEGLVDKGLAAVEKHYRDVSTSVGSPIDVPERAINELGYAALSRNEVTEAIALFRRNADANPSSANAWDSLADGLAKAGRLREAAEAADKGAELAARFDLPNRSDFARNAKKLNDRLRKESEKP